MAEYFSACVRAVWLEGKCKSNDWLVEFYQIVRYCNAFYSTAKRLWIDIENTALPDKWLLS